MADMDKKTAVLDLTGAFTKDLTSRVAAALEVAERYGTIDGDHHRTWVIDQMVRALVGKDYPHWLEKHEGWEPGIAP